MSEILTRKYSASPVRNSDEEKHSNRKKLHRTLAEPMQEQYTSIEEKCNTCQKLLSNFKKPFADAVGDIEIVLVISRGHVAGVEFA